MKPLRYPVTKETAAYMKKRKLENLERSKTNKNELWMGAMLKTTGRKWTSSATWGYRIFDWWCHELGIAVEVDGPEHNKDYDAYRDEYNFRRSGIIVLRVRNRNEDDALRALSQIAVSDSWTDRRIKMGIDSKDKRTKRWLVDPSAPVPSLPQNQRK